MRVCALFKKEIEDRLRMLIVVRDFLLSAFSFHQQFTQLPSGLGRATFSI